MSDPEETNFRKSLGGTSRQGGVTCWPEAVKHLLRTYATPASMREAMDNLPSVLQGDTETKESYQNRFHETINHSGNVYNEGENITLYIDGLTSIIRTIVAHHRESVSRRDMTFVDIAHFARTEDESDRARGQRKTAKQGYFLTNPTARAATQMTRGTSKASRVNVIEWDDQR